MYTYIKETNSRKDTYIHMHIYIHRTYIEIYSLLCPSPSFPFRYGTCLIKSKSYRSPPLPHHLLQYNWLFYNLKRVLHHLKWPTFKQYSMIYQCKLQIHALRCFKLLSRRWEFMKRIRFRPRKK